MTFHVQSKLRKLIFRKQYATKEFEPQCHGQILILISDHDLKTRPIFLCHTYWYFQLYPLMMSHLIMFLHCSS